MEASHRLFLILLCLVSFNQIEAKSEVTTTFARETWEVWASEKGGICNDILNIISATYPIRFDLQPEDKFRAALNKVN